MRVESKIGRCPFFLLLLADGSYHLIAVASARILGRPGNTRKGTSRQAMPAGIFLETVSIAGTVTLKNRLLSFLSPPLLGRNGSLRAMGTTCEEEDQGYENQKGILCIPDNGKTLLLPWILMKHLFLIER
jgi:hypothetical protein